MRCSFHILCSAHFDLKYFFLRKRKAAVHQSLTNWSSREIFSFGTGKEKMMTMMEKHNRCECTRFEEEPHHNWYWAWNMVRLKVSTH